VENDVWRDVSGFEDCYQISNNGKLKSKDRMKVNGFGKCSYKGVILKPRLYNGYYRFTLQRLNKRRQVFIHRLVAEAFITNPENKPEVNHINGIRHDNRVENLEWCTRSENQLHAYKIGLQTPTIIQGERHHKARLSEKDVLEIRRLYEAGVGMTELSKMFNMNRGSIHHIIKRTSWKHI